MDYRKEIETLRRRSLRKRGIEGDRWRMSRVEALLPEAPMWAISSLLEIHYSAARRSGNGTPLKYHPCMDPFMAVMAEVRLPAMTDVGDLEDRGRWAALLRLSAHLFRQRDRPGSADLETAVMLADRALPFIWTTDPGSDALLDALGLWGTTLQLVAERTPDEGLLRSAAKTMLDWARGIGEAAPQSGIAPHFHAHTALALRTVAGAFEDSEALDASIDLYRLALSAQALPIPGGGNPRGYWLGNLGNALRHRFAANGAPRDFEEAKAALSEAIERTANPAGRVKLGTWLSELYESRASRSTSAAESEVWRGRAGAVAEGGVGGTSPTTDAAFEKDAAIAFMQVVWARSAEGRFGPRELLDGLPMPQFTSTAIEWITAVAASRFETRRDDGVLDATVIVLEDAERRLPPGSEARTDAVVARAMLLHLYAGAGGRGSRWEEGRLLALEVLRTPRTSAKAAAKAGILLGVAALAQDRFTEAADGFESAFQALAAMDRTGLDYEQYLRRVFATIRMPGDLVSTAAGCAIAAGDAERALQLVEAGMAALAGRAPQRHPLDMTSLASAGPIVSVIRSWTGVHAIVATQGRTEIVPLDFADSRPSTDEGQAEDALSDFLEYMWDAAGVPILAYLADRAITTRRLWWLPVGPFAMLPLHAAGYHRAGEGRSFLDTTVSSYLVSLDTLAGHRSRPPLRPTFSNSLVAAYPRPEHANGHLPFAADEAERVAAELGTTALLLNDKATRDAVMACSQNAAIEHYVCHGGADPLNPAGNGIELADGQLTINQLTDRRRRDAWLVYLSACETAKPSEALIAPPLTVGAAFHLSGYRHVIGTLTFLHDDTPAAPRFYRQLRAADPALALHRTVKELRDERRRLPSHWSTLIHLGPEN
ncbi:CHAT domain-containing protein [Streptomyces sp. NPDC051771]|uniref:CHAT domain-containing protein n=1 Tax=Streptomyces sp. NPDC051771 TaxID=3154847 RepID=UPI00342A51C4